MTNKINSKNFFDFVSFLFEKLHCTQMYRCKNVIVNHSLGFRFIETFFLELKTEKIATTYCFIEQYLLFIM